MGSEKFCLRWNDFETNISLAFRELRNEKDFFDVTIACEDEQINAHKVILSACSPFFRDILRRNPHQHPLLYLSGVKLVDLQSVLNFMYHGEVSVAQEELNTFLAVAEDLKVKGLTQGKSASVLKPVSNFAHTNQPLKHKAHRSNPSQPVKQTWTASSSKVNILTPEEDDDIQELVPVKPEPIDLPPSSQHHVTSLPTHQSYTLSPHQASHAVAAADDPSYDYQEEGYDEHYYEADQGTAEANYDGNKDVESQMAKNDDGFTCLICGRVSARKENMKKHIESVHIQDEPKQCGLCEKKFKNKNSLQNHMSMIHRNTHSISNME